MVMRFCRERSKKPVFNTPRGLGLTSISSQVGGEELELPSCIKQVRKPDKHIECNAFQTLENRQRERVIPERKEANAMSCLPSCPS